MSESGQAVSADDGSLARALLSFYDEFAEFNDQCAFLCAALACVLVDEGCNSERVVRGAGYWSFWMRQQMDVLQEKIKQIQQRAFDEAHASKE